MMGKNNAKIVDWDLYLRAGIDPKTRRPIRAVDCVRKEAIKKLLRVMDEQQAINRYTCYNNPTSLSSQELERLLYYRGSLCFFYIKELDSFYFMPYALDGTIDFYGRYNTIHPVPITQGGDSNDERKKQQYEYLANLKLDVLWDVPTEEEMNDPSWDPSKKAIILYDYSRQLSQEIIPRQLLQDPLLDIMSDCIPFMRTALLNNTGIEGVKVTTEDEQTEVVRASMAIDNAALEGRKYVPIMASVELQELTGGGGARSEEFMLAMQSLDNFRLSAYGLQEGGLFQKRSNMLEAEQSMNAGNASLVLQDGLCNRQRFADIANAVWGVGISWEVSEPAIMMDRNMDGMMMDEMDERGTMQGDQPEVTPDV